MVARLGKVLPQMPGNRSGRPQQGQGIDESEELNFDSGIGHGPFHEPIIPPSRSKQPGRGAVQAGEDLPADVPRQILQALVAYFRCHAFNIEDGEWSQSLLSPLTTLPLTLHKVCPSGQVVILFLEGGPGGSWNHM